MQLYFLWWHDLNKSLTDLCVLCSVNAMWLREREMRQTWLAFALEIRVGSRLLENSDTFSRGCHCCTGGRAVVCSEVWICIKNKKKKKKNSSSAPLLLQLKGSWLTLDPYLQSWLMTPGPLHRRVTFSSDFDRFVGVVSWLELLNVYMWGYNPCTVHLIAWGTSQEIANSGCLRCRKPDDWFSYCKWYCTIFGLHRATVDWHIFCTYCTLEVKAFLHSCKHCLYCMWVYSQINCEIISLTMAKIWPWGGSAGNTVAMISWRMEEAEAYDCSRGRVKPCGFLSLLCLCIER